MSTRSLKAYHGAKGAVLGNQSGRASPSWRGEQQAQRRASGPGASGAHGAPGAAGGSKVLISNLPKDVRDGEVEVRVCAPAPAAAHACARRSC
jgi:hypothetical protein